MIFHRHICVNVAIDKRAVLGARVHQLHMVSVRTDGGMRAADGRIIA